jgi:succinate dehydrogenase / fumarate reductase cytochrome b subunit
MTDAPKPIRDRPLSPHMEIWRWHITMLSSILHRATGVGLYVGALIAAYWALALASGPVGYENFLALIGSPLGKLVLFGLTVSIFYHLANGVRHLFWDSGEGFTPATANLTAAAAITFAIVVSVFIWGAALFTGAAL